MNVATLHVPRAVPFNAISFTAYKVSDGMSRTYELGEVSGVTLDEALNNALATFSLFHKDTLIIRETGKDMRVHVFAIKRKSTPRYVYKDYATRAVHDLYAAHVVSMDGGVLAA